MAIRVTPSERLTSVGQHADMERSIAVSARTTGFDRSLLVGGDDGAGREDPDPPPRRRARPRSSSSRGGRATPGARPDSSTR